MTKKEQQLLIDLKKQASDDFLDMLNSDLGKVTEEQKFCSSDEWFLLGKKYYEKIKGERAADKYNAEMVRRCFTLAALSGKSKYQKLLSDCYFNGLFGKGEKYDEEGMYYLELAADIDDAPELYTNMALRYLYGKGVAKDSLKAFHLFKVAADIGKDGVAARYVGEYYDGTIEEESIKESQKDACEYYKLSAEQGDSYGQCLYGKELYSGKNVPQDYDKAFEFFTKSAEQNDPNGIFMQAQCIWFGFGVNEDKQRAFELFKKAAELGSAQGALDAGKALYLGEGTQKNVEQALVYFEKSAAGGIAEAKDAIEICRKEIEQ